MSTHIPDSQAIQIPSPKTRPTIGFLTHSISDEYGIVLWHGMVDAAKQKNLNLICFVSNDHPPTATGGYAKQAKVVYDLVSPENIDGLVVSGGPMSWVMGVEGFSAFLERYRSMPTVTITLGTHGMPNLIVDNRAGIREMLRHFIEVHGYRRVGFIQGPEGNIDADERYQVYRETLADYGITFDPHLVAPGNFSNQSGREAVQLWFDQRQIQLEAIIGVNDLAAFGALEALQERGYKVPNEIAIGGFDDVRQAEAVIPPLTTVRQPTNLLGYRAAEVLLSLIAGEDVPEQIILPTQLVVRQSCGCVNPIVLQSAAGELPASGEAFETVIVAQRETIVAEMAQTVGETERGAAFSGQMFDAFTTELQGGLQGTFLTALDESLRQVAMANGSIVPWQNTLSAMRRQMLPYLGEHTLLRKAEDLWQQARVTIGEIAQQVGKYQALKAEQRNRLLRDIGARLVSTFDVVGVMNLLAEELPHMGFPRCYLALHENPALPVGWSRLILAYTEAGRIALGAEGQRFPSHQLVPQAFLPKDHAYNMVLIPLYFEFTDDQIGFMVFEGGSLDGPTYDALRVEISSALQGDLLIQRVRERTDELAQANAEIRTLNDQLKEENLRMSAELDISRRIQQMVLPSPEELEKIDGLEIVGFMEPADEVGGDYYDVLKEKGTVHIGIGDVTGHGLESGLLMLMTQTAIRTLIDHGETDPVAFLNTLNRTLYNNIQRMNVDRSLTLSFVNYQDKQLKIVGQHEEMLVVRKGGQVERVDTIDLGFPIGLSDDIQEFVSEATVSLEEGDGIVLYTDGITEAENMNGEMYGIERLCQVVSQSWSGTAEKVKQAVIADVNRHIGKQKVYDDLTLVVLKQK